MPWFEGKKYISQQWHMPVGDGRRGAGSGYNIHSIEQLHPKSAEKQTWWAGPENKYYGGDNTDQQNTRGAPKRDAPRKCREIKQNRGGDLEVLHLLAATKPPQQRTIRQAGNTITRAENGA